jgi:hypothetical protein
MAIKKIYLGSIGPFEYDDAEDIDDPDGDFSGEKRQALRSNGVVQGAAGSFPGGSSGSFTIVTAIQINTGVLQYKTRSLTFASGCISSFGTESGWTIVPTI